MARGMKDALIPKRAWNYTLKTLDNLGIDPVETHEYEIGHTLNSAVLRDMCTWLEKVLPPIN